MDLLTINSLTSEHENGSDIKGSLGVERLINTTAAVIAGIADFFIVPGKHFDLSLLSHDNQKKRKQSLSQVNNIF